MPLALQSRSYEDEVILYLFGAKLLYVAVLLSVASVGPIALSL